jgi:hypothetical protein
MYRPLDIPPEGPYTDIPQYVIWPQAILPLETQFFKGNHLPVVPRLHGFSVSPVQGQLSSPGVPNPSALEQKELNDRRYRLMLEYEDQTIFTYELRKPTLNWA